MRFLQLFGMLMWVGTTAACSDSEPVGARGSAVLAELDSPVQGATFSCATDADCVAATFQTCCGPASYCVETVTSAALLGPADCGAYDTADCVPPDVVGCQCVDRTCRTRTVGKERCTAIGCATGVWLEVADVAGQELQAFTAHVTLDDAPVEVIKCPEDPRCWDGVLLIESTPAHIRADVFVDGAEASFDMDVRYQLGVLSGLYCGGGCSMARIIVTVE